MSLLSTKCCLCPGNNHHFILLWQDIATGAGQWMSIMGGHQGSQPAWPAAWRECPLEAHPGCSFHSRHHGVRSRSPGRLPARRGGPAAPPGGSPARCRPARRPGEAGACMRTLLATIGCRLCSQAIHIPLQRAVAAHVVAPIRQTVPESPSTGEPPSMALPCMPVPRLRWRSIRKLPRPPRYSPVTWQAPFGAASLVAPQAPPPCPS